MLPNENVTKFKTEFIPGSSGRKSPTIVMVDKRPTIVIVNINSSHSNDGNIDINDNNDVNDDSSFHSDDDSQLKSESIDDSISDELDQSIDDGKLILNENNSQKNNNQLRNNFREEHMSSPSESPIRNTISLSEDNNNTNTVRSIIGSEGSHRSPIYSRHSSRASMQFNEFSNSQSQNNSNTVSANNSRRNSLNGSSSSLKSTISMKSRLSLLAKSTLSSLPTVAIEEPIVDYAQTYITKENHHMTINPTNKVDIISNSLVTTSPTITVTTANLNSYRVSHY